ALRFRAELLERNLDVVRDAKLIRGSPIESAFGREVELGGAVNVVERHVEPDAVRQHVEDRQHRRRAEQPARVAALVLIARTARLRIDDLVVGRHPAFGRLPVHARSSAVRIAQLQRHARRSELQRRGRSLTLRAATPIVRPMPRTGPRLFISVFVFVLSLAASARADVTRFDLAGTVTDATGGVLPGVTVTLKNSDTGFVRSPVTDDQGRYSFTALNPTGRWTLSVELPGFAPQNREGLEFQANTKPEINFRLSVGSLQEAVTVQASSPLIRTRESELSTILDTKQVENLPTNGRNFLSLLQTSGSVVPTGATSSSNISVNGQGTRMANFVADGVSMTGREIRT